MKDQIKKQYMLSEGAIKKLILLWCGILLLLVYSNYFILMHVESAIQETPKKISWILGGQVFVLLSATFFIVAPMFFKFRNHVRKTYFLSNLYRAQSEELEHSRLAALSIMEDAQKARAEAEKSRDAVVRLASIVEGSQDAILSKTLDGVITSWNKGAEHIYGYTAEEAMGQHLKFIIPPDKHHELETILNNLKTGKQIGHLETKRLTKSGKTIDVMLSISPIKDAAGNITGASAIGRDITLLKEAERAILGREKWFRSLIEHSSDLLIQLDVKGRIIYTSPSLKRILGYDMRERIGHSIFEFIHPDDLDNTRQLFSDLLRKPDHIVKGDARFRHKNGSWHWMEGLGHNLIHEPSIQAIVINCWDSTENKNMTEQLKQNEEKYRLLVESTNIIPWEADPKTFQFTYVGPQAEKILGYPPDEWYSEDFWPKHIHPEDRDYAVKYCLEKSGHQKDFDFEYRMLSNDGRIIWFRDTVSVVQPESNGNALLRGFLINITEQKNKDLQIKEYTLKLKENNRELEQFAFVTSHDLQEPLRIISNYVHILQQKCGGLLDPSAVKYISYITRNTERLQEMINSLLEYSRLDRKGSGEEFVDAGECCDQAIENLAISIRRKKADVTRGDLPVVFGNKMNLIRLFQNLINNAIKYCDKETPRVRVSSTKEEGYWIFSVEDNGIGIEQEYYEQIFEVFKRLHTKEKYQGTGMGLSICKKIVEQSGGRMWVESKINQGSTFHFSLPKVKEAVYEYHTA